MKWDVIFVVASAFAFDMARASHCLVGAIFILCESIANVETNTLRSVCLSRRRFRHFEMLLVMLKRRIFSLRAARKRMSQICPTTKTQYTPRQHLCRLTWKKRYFKKQSNCARCSSYLIIYTKLYTLKYPRLRSLRRYAVTLRDFALAFLTRSLSMSLLQEQVSANSHVLHLNASSISTPVAFLSPCHHFI